MWGKKATAGVLRRFSGTPRASDSDDEDEDQYQAFSNDRADVDGSAERASDLLRSVERTLRCCRRYYY